MKHSILLSIQVISIWMVIIEHEVLAEDGIDIKIKPKIRTYSVSVDLTSEEIIDEHHRDARSPSSCQLPKSLDHSQLYCKSFPSKIECLQTCVFGYTLSTGVQHKMRCFTDVGQWTPRRMFDDCKPFVDCGVTLQPGGKMKCATHFVDKGTSCDISCEHFENRRAVPKKTYRCNIDGNWTPKLPHCARPGSGIILVPEPSEKEPKEYFDLKNA
ncbi:uncharacterized protein [Parasteatoda tepidariorum]|uniref:uncharacterized protein n=1 Tax=Parasteatoda tepidariorum TaxID=114398 RepID=UPI00077FCA31|nr:uncharacterized protein LOC107442877 [Parasteatoda tepidariorum]